MQKLTKKEKSMKRSKFINAICGTAIAVFFASSCETRTEPVTDEDEVETAPEYIDEMTELADHPLIREAFDIILELEERTLEDHIKITEIPAPPFMEDERAAAFLDMIREAGVDEAYIDDEGNVIGIREGTKGDRVLVLSAHMDTVFPEGTDVTVRMSGDTLFAPGVGDDSRGMAIVLTVLRAMNKAGIETEGDVWFVGTVGEEGLGDLRGVKHLFREGGPQIDAFISVDGAGDSRIVNQGLGSVRYRTTFKGPGGHSWGAFGLGNPAHALAQAINMFDEKAGEFLAGDVPRTSYNVGRIGGGTSINSIPYESWMEVDMRSVCHDHLMEIESIYVEAMKKALEEQNSKRASGRPLEIDLDKIGDRPSGEIKPSTPLVQRAMAAAKQFGFEPRLARSSTDSNIPISLGIPAVTIGRGGAGGANHSLDEWWANIDGHIAIQRTLLVTVAEAGLAR